MLRLANAFRKYSSFQKAKVRALHWTASVSVEGFMFISAMVDIHGSQPFSTHLKGTVIEVVIYGATYHYNESGH